MAREKLVNFLVSDEERAMIDVLSRARGVTTSDLLRGFVRAAYRRFLRGELLNDKGSKKARRTK